MGFYEKWWEAGMEKQLAELARQKQEAEFANQEEILNRLSKPKSRSSIAEEYNMDDYTR